MLERGRGRERERGRGRERVRSRVRNRGESPRVFNGGRCRSYFRNQLPTPGILKKPPLEGGTGAASVANLKLKRVCKRVAWADEVDVA